MKQYSYSDRNFGYTGWFFSLYIYIYIRWCRSTAFHSQLQSKLSLYFVLFYTRNNMQDIDGGEDLPWYVPWMACHELRSEANFQFLRAWGHRLAIEINGSSRTNPCLDCQLLQVNGEILNVISFYTQKKHYLFACGYTSPLQMRPLSTARFLG